MVNIQPRISLTRPSMPCNSARRGGGRRHVLIALGLDREAESFEVEMHSVLQIRPGVIMKLNVCRVGVVRGPLVRLTQQRPDLRCTQTRDNDFV
ncbi:hypothetical protein D3C84_834530 [compost metagenome]